MSRFGHALGTPNWCEPGFAQCFHPRVNTSILTFGDFPVSDYTGDVPPACILFWGHNPVLSGPDGETRFNVMEALAHNPRTIVVDPRRTALAEKADLWLQIRPGADDALALAMLNVVIGEKLYDEPFVTQWTHGFAELAAHVKKFTPEWAEPITWVAADQIRAAARLFARPSRPCWIGAAPSSTRRNASRPYAPSRCCRRSPAISTCRAAGCSACMGSAVSRA